MFDVQVPRSSLFPLHSSFRTPSSRSAAYRSRFSGHSSLFPLPSSRSASPSAFTLLELLTVIIIIAILAGMILGFSKYAMVSATTSRAKSEIAAMENALESFKNDNGFYPSSGTNRPTVAANNTNSYVVFTALAAGSKKYYTFKATQLHVTTIGTISYTNIFDPYGTDYSYYCIPGAGDQTNRYTFDLWSFGPDGKNDTPDDIVNWRR